MSMSETEEFNALMTAIREERGNVANLLSVSADAGNVAAFKGGGSQKERQRFLAAVDGFLEEMEASRSSDVAGLQDILKSLKHIGAGLTQNVRENSRIAGDGSKPSFNTDGYVAALMQPLYTALESHAPDSSVSRSVPERSMLGVINNVFPPEGMRDFDLQERLGILKEQNPNANITLYDVLKESFDKTKQTVGELLTKHGMHDIADRLETAADDLSRGLVFMRTLERKHETLRPLYGMLCDIKEDYNGLVELEFPHPDGDAEMAHRHVTKGMEKVISAMKTASREIGNTSNVIPFRS